MCTRAQYTAHAIVVGEPIYIYLYTATDQTAVVLKHVKRTYNAHTHDDNATRDNVRAFSPRLI